MTPALGRHHGCRKCSQIGRRHVGELHPDVKPCRPLRAEVDYPDHLCPAANRLAHGKEHFQVEPRPDRKALVREDPDSAEADVLGVALVMQQRRPRRPAQDVGLDARIAPPV